MFMAPMTIIMTIVMIMIIWPSGQHDDDSNLILGAAAPKGLSLKVHETVQGCPQLPRRL